MAELDIDFEGTGVNANGGGSAGGTQETGAGNASGKDGVTDLNGGGTTDVTGKDGNNGDETVIPPDNNDGNNGDDNNNNGGEQDKNSSTGELEVGMQVEFEDKTYTVDKDGNLVDDKGNIFKNKDEVKDWMDSLEKEEDNNLSIDAIQDSVGIEITDETGKKVEFTNDAQGVKAYVDSVIELKSKELQEGAVNKLYADNPLLKQFQDYVTVTGSPVGFGELPDRTGITIDKDNATQQEAIVRMAAKEFGNKSMNDNYIKYLKDTGSLYDEAVAQLKALQDKDKAVRVEIEQRAEAARAQELKELNDYWNKVNDVIKGRTIAGYKLPESFVKEVNGQKQTLTPNDFYNYLQKQTEVDADGNRITAYQRDLANESDDDYLNREILTAWLMYTGGTYQDLVNMAVKEEQVRVLRLKAKERSSKKTVKFVKPQGGKTSVNDIVLE